MQLLPNEVSKYIEGYEGKYKITSMGRVYNTYTGNFFNMRDRTSSQPYLTVTLSNSHTRKVDTYKVHRLIGKYFLRKPKNHLKTELNHKDHDTLNNRADNLEWTTPSENKQWCLKAGRGNRKGRADFLTQDDADEMRSLYASGEHTQTAIAIQFGCSRAHVSTIINYKHFNRTM